MFIFNYSVGKTSFIEIIVKYIRRLHLRQEFSKKMLSSLRKICFCIFFEKYYKKKNPLHVGTSTRIFYKNN